MSVAAIEQARARGLDADRIAADFGVPVERVLDVFARMDDALTATAHDRPSDTGACGTMLGYNRHRAAGEQRCAKCLTARRKYERGRPGRRRAAPEPCGTSAAYHRHYKRGELACEPCLAAHAAQAEASRAAAIAADREAYLARRRAQAARLAEDPAYVEGRRRQRQREWAKRIATETADERAARLAKDRARYAAAKARREGNPA